MVALFLLACSETSPEQAFKNGDYEQAFELWQPLAENGDLNAYYFLGLHYYLGLGVNKDNATAKTWFERAAIKGHPAAQLSLGNMYQNGESVEQNFATAFMWYYASASQGNTQAPKKISLLFDQKKLFPNQVHHSQVQAKPYIINPMVSEELQP